jgi:hypothetical protein
MIMADEQLFCENCHQRLDSTDKFCRQCGLPTVRQAQAQKRVPDFPPDTAELKRNFEVQPDPSPFLRTGGDASSQETLMQTPTTGTVLRATNPTHTLQSASVTIIMVGLIIFMVLAGAALLILAFRFP